MKISAVKNDPEVKKALIKSKQNNVFIQNKTLKISKEKFKK